MTQTQIPGTERSVDPELEAAAEEVRARAVDKADSAKRLRAAEERLLAIQIARTPGGSELLAKLAELRTQSTFRYHDSDGIEIESILKIDPKPKVHKTGESTPHVGEGATPTDDEPDDDEADEAAANQRASNVEEDDDGDVVVPDKAEKPRKAKSKKGRRK